MLHTESFMGSFIIELIDKIIEFSLLLKKIHPWGTRCFFLES